MSLTVQPTYLVDSNGDVWLVSASNGGMSPLLTKTPGASPVFTSVFLNDRGVSKTWKLTVIPVTGGVELHIDQVAYVSSSPPQLLVNSPDGNLWGIQFTAGVLQIAVGATSCQPDFPRVGCLFNYDLAAGPNGQYKVFSQPSGIGGQVFPQQTTGEILGLWIMPFCNHSVNNPEVTSAAVGGIQSAIIRCPLCGCVARILTPYSDIFLPSNEFIIP